MRSMLPLLVACADPRLEDVLQDWADEQGLDFADCGVVQDPFDATSEAPLQCALEGWALCDPSRVVQDMEDRGGVAHAHHFFVPDATRCTLHVWGDNSDIPDERATLTHWVCEALHFVEGPGLVAQYCDELEQTWVR